MKLIELLKWPSTWLANDSVATSLVLLSLVVTFGLILGSIRVRGIRLGISGVLFSGLLCGQLRLTIDPHVLQFLRAFSLVVFMYAIGLEIGPSFVTSMRTEGLRLNILGVIAIVLGAAMTLLICRSFPHGASPGVFVGAFTTTAGLASAQETLRGTFSGGPGNAAAAQAATAYSITYPLGIVGPMLVIQALRMFFGVSVQQEREALRADEQKRHTPIETVDFEMTQAEYVGLALGDLPALHNHKILLSRMVRDNIVSVPDGKTKLALGDLYRAVGTRDQLEQLVKALGRPSATDLTHLHGDIERCDLVVTRPHVLRRTLRELNLTHRIGFTIVSVSRAGVDLVPTGSLRLAFADRVIVVGPRNGKSVIEAELGNSPETLDQPRLVPVFLGIVLGVMVGSFPLLIPGVHSAIRLGLAGGPLVIAIVLAQLGSVGSVIWYMPAASNKMFRDLGLAMFLACVGLSAGEGFIQRAATGNGLAMLICGAAVTIFPVLIVGCFARLLMRMNFVTLSGWVAGTMGSSTTLLFASEFTGSESPALAYAAVTPLATLVPILLAQFLVMFR